MAVEPVGERLQVRLKSIEGGVDLGAMEVFGRHQQEIVVWDTASEGHVLDQRSLFLGSSRLPGKLESIPGFFEGLLQIGVRGRDSGEVIINGLKTACEPYCRRLGELFGIAVRDVECFPLEVNKARRRVELLRALGQRPVFVFDFADVGIDRQLMLMATRAVVLSVRPKGNLWRAAFARLKSGRSFELLLDESLVQKKVGTELLSCGATGWYLIPMDQGSSEKDSVDAGAGKTLRCEDETGEEFLLHWTRRRSGPWPQQDQKHYIDDLIFGVDRKDHRPVSSLYRILASQKLLGTSELTRDPRPVVCFSDLTFDELKARRVFRSHLARWDFEPYGIGIRRSWLEEQGARKVVYGGDSVWEQMAEELRPFFQFCDAERGTDWSVEKEWRVVGDLDLRKVPGDAAIVFVATVEEAERVQEVSRWPVVVLREG